MHTLSLIRDHMLPVALCSPCMVLSPRLIVEKAITFFIIDLLQGHQSMQPIYTAFGNTYVISRYMQTFLFKMNENE